MAAQINPIWNQILTAHNASNTLPVKGRDMIQDTSQDTGTTSSSDGDSATISANDFLTLLVTEMQNQDPTADTDPNEYINQLVQVNSLEQLISINQTLTTDSSATPSGGAVKAVGSQQPLGEPRIAAAGRRQSFGPGKQTRSSACRRVARRADQQSVKRTGLRPLPFTVGKRGRSHRRGESNMASFYIPLTGLNADSTALNTIANNLSNMNTTGYKSQSVNFSDLFYQQVGEAGSGDPIQRGSGTQVSSIETDFSNGSPDTTEVDTNVALQGNGFFVVGSGNNTLLTRDGDFSLDLNGNLITSGGLSVMGFPAANGIVNTNAPLAPVHIPVGEVEPPSATTTFGMTATLDSAAKVGDSLSGKIQVYDSLGNDYQAQVTYTKTATNTWSYNVTLPDTLAANNSNVGAVNTQVYNFGSSGGSVATVDPATNLTITGPNAGGVSTTINAPTVTPGRICGHLCH